MSNRPIGIDLFAGAGGMSLGFEQAGFDVIAAVEIDPIHAAVHHFNFPSSRVFARSVIGLSGEELRSVLNIESREIDVVFGGPPCQGFSLIGQRMLEDPRNSLVKEFVRLVAELRPRAFVFENVKGLTVGKHRQFLDFLIEEFAVIGYQVQSPWRVLNALHYGVPQNRERLFLLGSRKDISVPAYPATISFPALDLLDTSPVALAPTCRDALEDLPDAEAFPELIDSDAVEFSPVKAISSYARYCRAEGPNAWLFGHRRSWKRSLLTSSMRAEHNELSRGRFAATLPGSIEPVSRFLKLDPRGYCNTLRAGTDSARGAFTSPRPIHYRYPRCITVREMARLHGYPDWFRFHVTKWHGARQVGNSVPPPMARAIAAEVMKALQISPSVSKNLEPMGDERLLHFDMSEASAYWNVPREIKRRERGARVSPADSRDSGAAHHE